MDNLKFAQKRELCALTLFPYFYVFQNCKKVCFVLSGLLKGRKVDFHRGVIFT